MSNDFFDSIPQERSLNYKVIKEELRSVILSSINKIDREFPLDHIDGAQSLFRRLAYVAKNTYSSILFLCADNSEKIEFSLSAHPLLRLLLEEVFILIFISEDLQTRIDLYHKGGWWKMKEEYDRFSARYHEDPDWVSWLSDYCKYLEKTRILFGITPDQVKDHKQIAHWPTPGRMKNKVTSPVLKEHLQYLDDWFYIQFSQAAHLSFPGLAKMGECLLPDAPDEKEAYLKKLRSDSAFQAITLILAFFSEIENILRFNLKEKLKYLWTLVGEYWPEAKGLYNKRYKGILT